MKNKKHDKVLKDRERMKKRSLDNIATKMLKQDELNEKLRGYKLKDNFLDFFDEST